MSCTVAIAPTPTDVVRSAVEAAGGRVVGPDASPDALVWMAPRDVDGLRQVLSDAPSIRWVQLPFAGIERFLPFMAPELTWTAAGPGRPGIRLLTSVINAGEPHFLLRQEVLKCGVDHVGVGCARYPYDGLGDGEACFPRLLSA